MPGTAFSPEATNVHFDDESMWVTLEDGRTIGVPLAWFPRLMRGDRAQREDFFLSPSGIHWEALDEDVSIASLLADRMETPAPARAA